MTYSKSDIQMHSSSGPYSRTYPAVNVKCYRWPDADKIAETFGCSEATAERASRYAYEMHQEGFWEMVQADAEDVLGPCKVYSAGRSSGWLVVEGLPNPEEWDAIAVAKWGRFERMMRAEVAYLCSDEAVIESIRANEWALDAEAITTAMEAV